MTTRRTYSCDLCGTSIDPNNDEGVGIYWIGTKMQFKPVRDVEHHICDKCSEQIIDLWRARAKDKS